MSAIDRNKIFFGLVHYILSEQNNVDWVLKTSLVNFTGINSTVSDQQYEKKSLSDDIIDYIHQVKPYHVQFEQFIEKYSNKQDYCDVMAYDVPDMEIDIRFDAVTSEVDEQGNMSDEEFMNTHAANRIWACKKNDYADNLEELKEYIKDVLNCHFKGITVDGKDFNIDKFGYDVFLYDENLYDAPTVTADYYIIDEKENVSYPYTKSYVGAGISTFKLSINPTASISVMVNGISKEFDYNINTSILNIHNYKSNIHDKILILTTLDGIREGHFYVCSTFEEGTFGTNIYKYQQLGENEFAIPDSQFGARRMVVNVQTPSGSRRPTNNYEYTSNGIRLYDELGENYHVLITVVDFGELYDKIYTYEDCYGQSNNLISLDGNEFLRPYYEENRPSELLVNYPINNLKIFVEDGDVLKSVQEVNHKGDNTIVSLSKSMVTKLVKPLVAGDRTISVDNIKKLKMPSVNSDGLKTPGYILIGAEIIEFFDYDEENSLLKSIRRGSNGSVIGERYESDTVVYNYNMQTKKSFNYECPSIEMVCEKGQREFPIPEKFIKADNVSVFKRYNITLLSDIDENTQTFLISDNKIILPNKLLNKRGIIFIDGDKIYFDDIKETALNKKTVYEISGFTSSKSYRASESVIYSSIPTLLYSDEYEIVLPSEDVSKGSSNSAHILLNKGSKAGEVIIISNENA